MSDISPLLSAGREAFAGLLTDTCRITRAAVSGDDEFIDAADLDEDTGQYPEQGRVTVYEGPCRLQVKADINSNVVETTAGEREWTYTTSQFQLPVETPTDAIGSVDAVDVDHVAEILTAMYAPSMVGHLFNIQNRIGPKSHEVYARFRVREVV